MDGWMDAFETLFTCGNKSHTSIIRRKRLPVLVRGIQELCQAWRDSSAASKRPFANARTTSLDLRRYVSINVKHGTEN
jgi:hypothetical protein